MMTPERLRRAALQQLATGDPLRVIVAPSDKGVDLPDHLIGPKPVALDIGYNATPPIDDLDVGVDGITATMPFGGVYHTCVIPWTAVLALGASPAPSLPAPRWIPVVHDGGKN